MPTRAHRREPRLRRLAGRAGARPRRGEEAADARLKNACRSTASRFARSDARPRPANRRPIAGVSSSRDATDAQLFPAKPIDAGESRPSVPRAVADPPLSSSTHQQHLRDVLRREARLRREGREGRQGRHRRPRRVRGPRLGTLTLTTTLLSDPGSPRVPEARPVVRRERTTWKASRGPRGQSASSSARRARSLASPRSRPARDRRDRQRETPRRCCFVARTRRARWQSRPSQSRNSQTRARRRREDAS